MAFIGPNLNLCIDHLGFTKFMELGLNILIIGNGGREYSIGLKLKKEKIVNKIYFAPGNGATINLGENIEINDYEKLAKFAG